MNVRIYNDGFQRDAGMVLLQNSATFRWIQNNWLFTDNDQEFDIISVFGRSGGSQAISAPLAKEGITTNSTFGQVIRTGITVMSTDGATLSNTTEASMCAEPGDSGGAVRWAGVAHGVTSLSALDPDGTCRDVNPRMYFSIASDVETVLGVRIYESP